MEPSGIERKLAAVLAADVAGYSRLMGNDEESTMAAWWATTLALVALGASVALTAQLVEPAAFLRAMGLPDEHLGDLPSLGSGLRLANLWGTIALTAISVVYLLLVRRQFATARRPSTQT